MRHLRYKIENRARLRAPQCSHCYVTGIEQVNCYASVKNVQGGVAGRGNSFTLRAVGCRLFGWGLSASTLSLGARPCLPKRICHPERRRASFARRSRRICGSSAAETILPRANSRSFASLRMTISTGDQHVQEGMSISVRGVIQKIRRSTGDSQSAALSPQLRAHGPQLLTPDMHHRPRCRHKSRLADVVAGFLVIYHFANELHHVFVTGAALHERR